MAQWPGASHYVFLTCFSSLTYVTWLRDLCCDFYFTAPHSSHTCFCQVMWLFLQFGIIYKSNRAVGRMVGILGPAVWMVASGGRPCVPCSSYAYKDLSVSCLWAKQVCPVNRAPPMAPPVVVCSVISRDINRKVGILWDGALSVCCSSVCCCCHLKVGSASESEEARQCVLINLTSRYSESTVSPFQWPWKKTSESPPCLPSQDSQSSLTTKHQNMLD